MAHLAMSNLNVRGTSGHEQHGECFDNLYSFLLEQGPTDEAMLAILKILHLGDADELRKALEQYFSIGE